MADRTNEVIGRKNEKLNELRERVAELKAENERLRETLDEVLRTIRGPTYLVGRYEIYQPQIDVDRFEQWQSALDGGGDDDE